jgi:HEAT repeat protein
MPRGRCVIVLGALALVLPAWWGAGPRGAAQQPDAVDAKVLQAAGIPTDTPALLEFFRKRSLKETDRKRIEELIEQLNDRAFKVRARAKEELILRGPVVLPFLQRAGKSGTLEFIRLVDQCLRKIETGAGPDRPAAAARLLAARNFKDPEAARAALDALIAYLPFAGDEWLEDEVLAAVGVLALRQDQMDVLVEALRDRLPERRAAAGSVLAQRGTLEQRRLVRQLLQDPDPGVQVRVAASLAGRRVLSPASATADEAVVRSAGVGTTGEALVEFFRKRSPDEKAQESLKQMVRQLGDRSWSAREKATRRLIEEGATAVPLLRLAMENEGPETAARASHCLQKIKQGAGTELVNAAARLLARAGELPRTKPAAEARPEPGSVTPARALHTLLTYAPFAPDESVEDELLGCLIVLGVRATRVDPLLLGALYDPLAPRRAAAAYVLGRVGTREDCDEVRRLLRDPALKVRLRAAQGLLAARDRTAVPVLIDLLGKAPDSWAWRVEELLRRVAGDQGPDLPPATNLAEGRQRAVWAWQSWWAANAWRVDLTRAAEDDQRLGLTLIVEYDRNRGTRRGQVYECGRDGKPRWKVEDLAGPMDAQVLPNHRVLVAESASSRVTERDTATGAILWQYNVGNPVVCQRLPNGNTFVASYNMLIEVDPTRKVVFTHNLSPSFFLFDARKLRTGNIVCINSQGVLLEFDPVARKNVRTVNVGSQGNWCGVDPLPSGRYLVALMSPGEVREIDASGKVHWKCRVPGVFRASRLPNGNTLAVSMNSRTVAEFDRSGRRIWEKTCQGRPWRAHAR